MDASDAGMERVGTGLRWVWRQGQNHGRTLLALRRERGRTLTPGVWSIGRGGAVAGVVVAGGALALVVTVGVALLPTLAGQAGGRTATGALGRHAAGPGVGGADVTIASPRPAFIALNGQSPALSGTHVVWTATNGEGAGGSEDDRIFSYDLSTRRLDVAVRSAYGPVGLIGSYALAGNSLAYVDTGYAPGGILPWRVSIVNLTTRRSIVIASLARGVTSQIPPQIAYDGTHLLMVETVNGGPGSTHTTSVAVLYTPSSGQSRVLSSASDVSFGDPALGNSSALWTSTTYAPHLASTLQAYDLERRVLRTLPVGIVSQVAAYGDQVVWKTGLAGVPGHLVLYSVRQGRVLASNLTGTESAAFPAIGGALVSWTDAQGQRIRIYDLAGRRVVYSSPVVSGRYYGLTSVMPHAASWVYTVTGATSSKRRGYVVVHSVPGA